MSWLITPQLRSWTPVDSSAASYITAVEAADGQALEPAVRYAIDQFVLGCKADGIWNAIKASCILAGARTLAGALVPLAGTAPTNFNFVSGDYNRKTGLVGDGSTKHLNSNRNNNADPQNSKHICVYATSVDSRATSRTYIGVSYNATGWTTIVSNVASTFEFWVNTTSGVAVSLANSVGLLGASRSEAATFVGRSNRSNTIITKTSQTPTSGSICIYTDSSGGAKSNARLAFYSIGESLDLALLDIRVTTLVNALSAAIP